MIFLILVFLVINECVSIEIVRFKAFYDLNDKIHEV